MECPQYCVLCVVLLNFIPVTDFLKALLLQGVALSPLAACNYYHYFKKILNVALACSKNVYYLDFSESS